MTRIDKIKALCDAATKGPWAVENNHPDKRISDLSSEDGNLSITSYTQDRVPIEEHNATMQVLAQSRELVPELIALVEDMAGALEFYVDGHHEDPAKATLAKYKAWNEGE